VKAEVLATGADGSGNVFRLRGGHHEDDVRRWFLQSLEQRVEGRVGDLMSFVENVNLVAISGGSVASGVAQFANLVNSAIGGRVDLDHVHGVALANFDAGVTNSAGFGCGTVGRADFSAAIESLSYNAGDGGFADAAMAREDVAVRNAILRKGIEQGASDVILAGNVGKALRTVFPG
jgi:hypothetical protein